MCCVRSPLTGSSAGASANFYICYFSYKHTNRAHTITSNPTNRKRKIKQATTTASYTTYIPFHLTTHHIKWYISIFIAPNFSEVFESVLQIFLFVCLFFHSFYCRSNEITNDFSWLHCPFYDYCCYCCCRIVILLGRQRDREIKWK